MADNVAELQQARKLILAKRYDEARELLNTIDDPKAKNWLAQLDRVAPEKVKVAPPEPVEKTPWQKQDPTPLDPRLGIILVFIASIPVIGVILSWNWRRVGKPKWVWISAFLTVVLPLVSAIGLFMGLALFMLEPSSRIRFIGVGAGVFVANWVIIFGAIYLQYGAYKAFGKGGLEAARSHKYPWEQTLAVGLIVVALTIVGAAVFMFMQLRPQTFDTPSITLVYSPEWQLVEPATNPTCRRMKINCVFIFWKRPPLGSQVSLVKYTVGEGVTAQDLITTVYQGVREQPPGGHLVIYSTIPYVIAGQTTLKLRYTFDDPLNAAFNDEIDEFIFVNNQTAYEFKAIGMVCNTCEDVQKQLAEFFVGLHIKGLQSAA